MKSPISWQICHGYTSEELILLVYREHILFIFATSDDRDAITASTICQYIAF